MSPPLVSRELNLVKELCPALFEVDKVLYINIEVASMYTGAKSYST